MNRVSKEAKYSGEQVAPSGNGEFLGISLKSRSNAYDIHDYLRALIVSGRIKPGTVVSQAQLAREIGVSRTPVREATRMLQNEGLLQAEPNNRMRVRPFSMEELEAVYTARIVLEALGVALTIPKLSDQDIAELESSLYRMSSDDCLLDFNSFIAEHREFHRLLVRHSGDGLVDQIAKLNEQSTRYQFVYADSRESSWWLANAAAGHVELLAACRSRKVAWATRLMAQHLAQTALTTIAELSEPQSGHGASVNAALALVSTGADALKSHALSLIPSLSKATDDSERHASSD